MEDQSHTSQTPILPSDAAEPHGTHTDPPHHLRNRNRVPLVPRSATEDLVESMLCVPGTKLIPSGLDDIQIPRKDDIVLFVNAGGEQLNMHDSFVRIEGDSFSQGGDVLMTEENIVGGGKYSAMYQSARFGDFNYKFYGLNPGNYFIDLHLSEIINTNGPKGMRVFDVLAQDEKILSKVDIYALVGANKPLQVIDIKVSTSEDGSITLTFVSVSGSPSLCGICIRKALQSSDFFSTEKSLICKKCASTIEYSPEQNQSKRLKSVEKWEEKIQELANQYQLKTDECYQAWMLLTDANNELEKLRMELDNKLFQNDTLDHSVRELKEKLRKVCESYEMGKKYWLSTICNLEGKVKVMKKEYAQLSKDAHDCANSIPELSKMISAVQDLVTQCEDLKIKYSQEQFKRKKLYNQLQDMKGNIRVFCRCRPLNNAEISGGSAMVVDFEAAKGGDLGLLVGGSNKKIFKFDRVYAPRDGQVDVYMDASPLVTSVLDGYNVCIFAYGQTGTGKTFTMEGNESNRGVNYRTLEELFNLAKERKETFSYSISVSVLEVYNEQIRDLLATTPPSKKLEVKQGGEGVHRVPGIVEAKVENIKEVWDVLQTGSSARAVGSNNVNEHSSRSHCLLCVMVRTKNLISGESTKSKLWLVDLAGSERLAKTDAQGERLKEAQNINRSLSALGDVISALATKNNHIPYRNSKLTHLLQDSLGGDSKVLMFVQISPSDNDLSETLSSLNFATRVRGVELGPAKKQLDSGELLKMKQMLDKTRHDLKSKEETCSNLEGNIKGKDQLIKNLTDKNKELEGQLNSNKDFQRSVEKQLSDKLKWKEEHCMELEHKVIELENELKEKNNEDSLVLQQQVKEFEYNLRKCQQELECKLRECQNSQQKVKDLEYNLIECRKELDCNIRERQKSEQKVKDLESKLSDQSDCLSLLQSGNTFRVATPVSGTQPLLKDREGCIGEADSHVLKNSNSIHRASLATGHSSALLRGPDSLNEIKRKRELRNGSMMDSENIIADLSSERKTSTGEMNKTRKIDSTKAYSRFVRTTTKTVVAQKPLPSSRTVGRENKRGWH